MGKFARTWRLLGASWRLLQQDKRLLVFPVISGLALACLVALFVVPLRAETAGQLQPGAGLPWSGGMLLGLFVFYFLDSCVVVFFNSALIACVLRQIDGGEPSLAYGPGFAWQRLPQIMGWALLTATVGMLLRMLENRVGFVGKLVVGALGMAWSVTAFMVIPVLVAEGCGPIESYRRSIELLRRNWGEQIIGNVSFSLVFGAIVLIPILALLALSHGVHMGSVPVLAAAVVLVAWILAAVLVQTTLQTIYQAALYAYAAGGTAPPGFDVQWLADAFHEKPARR
ncbi:MAG TPA: DUF6159 family protein [Rhodanobacteraceae bacterium]